MPCQKKKTEISVISIFFNLTCGYLLSLLLLYIRIKQASCIVGKKKVSV